MLSELIIALPSNYIYLFCCRNSITDLKRKIGCSSKTLLPHERMLQIPPLTYITALQVACLSMDDVCRISHTCKLQGIRMLSVLFLGNKETENLIKYTVENKKKITKYLMDSDSLPPHLFQGCHFCSRMIIMFCECDNNLYVSLLTVHVFYW